MLERCDMQVILITPPNHYINLYTQLRYILKVIVSAIVLYSIHVYDNVLTSLPRFMYTSVHILWPLNLRTYSAKINR